MKLGTVVPYLKKIQNIYESCDTPLMAIVDNWLSKLLFESDTYNAHFHQEKVFKNIEALEKQDLKELLNGLNTDRKWLNRLKLTVDQLSYHSKMKMIEHLFQSITCQRLKQKIIMN